MVVLVGTTRAGFLVINTQQSQCKNSWLETAASNVCFIHKMLGISSHCKTSSVPPNDEHSLTQPLTQSLTLCSLKSHMKQITGLKPRVEPLKPFLSRGRGKNGNRHVEKTKVTRSVIGWMILPMAYGSACVQTWSFTTLPQLSSVKILHKSSQSRKQQREKHLIAAFICLFL